MKRLNLMIIVFALCAGFAQAQTSKPKSLTFDARHELKVMIPEGAKKVRIWFALPQETSQQQVANLKIESPLPYRIEREATEGSRFLYVEVNAPTTRDVTFVTTFRLT